MFFIRSFLQWSQLYKTECVENKHIMSRMTSIPNTFRG